MKVLITPRSFGKSSTEAMDLLVASGWTIVPNPKGRILTADEMKVAIADVDAIIVGVDPLTADVLACGKNLKIVSKYGVGTDNIDKAYCAEKGIAVTITQNANKEAVADFAFALMLAAARQIIPIDKDCRAGDWKKVTSLDLFGKTLGLMGMGQIGKSVAARAKGFSMNILAYDSFPDQAFAKEMGITYVDKKTLLETADLISLHLPLTPETKNIIDKAAFAQMKPTAIIVNTARGGLIHEDDLCDALENGQIFGAGLDVFEEEPATNKRLLALPNAVLGTHCAASTVGAVDQMSLMAAQHVVANKN